MTITLKLLREIRGLKQSTVADMLEISQSAYSKLERGITRIKDSQLQILRNKLNFHGENLEVSGPDEADTREAFILLFENYRMQLRYLTDENEMLRKQLNSRTKEQLADGPGKTL